MEELKEDGRVVVSSPFVGSRGKRVDFLSTAPAVSSI
jgi:hypothetical protein